MQKIEYKERRTSILSLNSLVYPIVIQKPKENLNLCQNLLNKKKKKTLPYKLENQYLPQKTQIQLLSNSHQIYQRLSIVDANNLDI